jgi:hypothetical protein
MALRCARGVVKVKKVCSPANRVPWLAERGPTNSSSVFVCPVDEKQILRAQHAANTLVVATPPIAGTRGPVPRRRFQKGSFVIEKNGGMYSVHYVDVERPDGTTATKQVKRFIGNRSQMSERAAKREHAHIMEEVNKSRGSVMPVIKGQTFADAVNKWRQAIAPNLCPSSVRSRESYLKNHIMPRFGRSGLLDINVDAIQQFATDLRKTLSGKTTLNVLATVFTNTLASAACA